MNRRGFLKGLGAAPVALVALPVVAKAALSQQSDPVGFVDPSTVPIGFFVNPPRIVANRGLIFEFTDGNRRA